MTLCLGLLIQAWRLGDGTLHDPFHFGEFFAALTTLTAADGTVTLLPLTIHGAIDILPGWLMSLAAGTDRHFLPTLLSYAALDSLASLLAVAVVARLGTAASPTSGLTLLATALLAPMCVGFRDVFLLTALWLHFVLRDRIEAEGVTARSTRLLEVALGAVVALGLHVSFDRGIAAAVSLGVAHLRRALILGQGSQPGRVAMASFGFTVLLGGLLYPLLTPSHYVENVLFLASTSAQWRYPWNRDTVTLTVTLLVLSVAVWALVLQGWRRQGATLPQQVDAIALALLTAFLLRIGSNRADTQHILMGLWGPLLLAAWWHVQGGWRSSAADLPTRVARLALIAGTAVLALKYKVHLVLPVTLALSCAAWADRYRIPSLSAKWQRGLLLGVLSVPALLMAGKFSRDIGHGLYRWMPKLVSARNVENMALSPSGVQWAAATLRDAGVSCVFDLSNNGLIQALVQRPNCSRITYPVYGGPAHETELIEAVSRQKPAALVSSSEHWAYAIDNRSMAVRFPGLERYIRKHYGDERCSNGYCVRMLLP